jgi:threonine/homoserine/homoserine lactone efflux protein
MGIEHLGLFVLAGLLLNLTPGPDVLYIVSQGMKRGARAGVLAALGITAGVFVHIAAAALGVSALIAASSTAFQMLAWLGAAYLVYVGVSMLGLGRRPKIATDSVAEDSMNTRVESQNGDWNVFVRGFWTNALNPKVALFFLAFLPQFISPSADNKALSFLLLGLLFNVNSLPVNLGYALLAAWAARRLALVQAGMRQLERLAGILFIAFGLKLAFSDSPA